MPGPYKFSRMTNALRPNTSPCRRRRGTEASRATSYARRTRPNCPRSWSSTKIGVSIRTSRMACRLAIADFIAFAPDALTSLGGYPGDDEKGGALFAKLDRAKMTEDFLASAMWLKSRPDSTGKLGAVGFCFGGGVVNQLAVRMGPGLAAGVPFYGSQPSAADAAKIKAPINAQYGELDTRITDGWPAFD